MSNKQAVNLNSLNLIQDELMSTIDTAATHLETFISEQDNDKVLQDCIASLQQIRGSLDLIQLHGACELAGEILDTASTIDLESETKLEEKLSALTKGFFVLSCYFEYTQQHEVGMPVLLVPYINDIRLVRGLALMPESYFEPNIRAYAFPEQEKRTPQPENLIAAVRRFRHMYQLGLLGLMREVNVEPSIQLMHRALAKIYKLSTGTPSQMGWWLATYTAKAFMDGDLSINIVRKRVFRQLDRAFKTLEKEGDNAFSIAAEPNQLKDLAYYIAIADTKNSELEKVTQLLGFDDLGYNEQVLQREAISLTGPSANTVQSVAGVLQVELNLVKEDVEKNLHSDCSDGYCYLDSIGRIEKAQQILQVVGLTSAAETLSSPLDALQRCQKEERQLDCDAADSLANAFLYVESVLSSLDKRNFSEDKLHEINRLTQVEMMSANHLEDAQLVVIEQVELSLQSIKNALTTFSDSSYDKTHLDPMRSLLDDIRGGMIVLSLPRAVAIIVSSLAFVEKTLMSTEEPAALEHMLETFADALVCLEYYLNSMKVDKNVSADSLEIAEDSLEALGYGV